MATETLTSEPTATFLTTGLDFIALFDNNSPAAPSQFAVSESLSAAKKPLDDEEEDEDEEDDLEDDEDVDDEDEEDDEFEDDEDDDDEDEEDEDEYEDDDDEEEDEDDDVDELQVGRRR